MKSLDPRISRLNISEKEVPVHLQQSPDQLITFEAFLQKRENTPYEHVGIVHAPNEDMAFVFAKEQFSRRSTCTGLMVCNTKNVMVTPYTELEENVYDLIDESAEIDKDADRQNEGFEIFHLTKRGKQHKHVGTVVAFDYDDALLKAKKGFNEDKPVLNVWIVKTSDIFFTKEENRDIWDLLPEKKHRDVTSYRAKEKLDQLKANQAH